MGSDVARICCRNQVLSKFWRSQALFLKRATRLRNSINSKGGSAMKLRKMWILSWFSMLLALAPGRRDLEDADELSNLVFRTVPTELIILSALLN